MDWKEQIDQRAAEIAKKNAPVVEEKAEEVKEDVVLSDADKIDAALNADKE